MTHLSRHLCRALRLPRSLLFGAAITILTPTVVLAHAVVLPKKSAPGAFEKYVLRVPNEKDSPTTRIEIHFPAGMRVVSFADVPGWQLEIITDSAKAIIGAVWTGTLPAKHFVEFPFEAGNPKTPTKVSWPTDQTYASGEVVEWTGSEGSKTPASVTSIEPLAQSAGIGGTWMAGAALLVAMISLGLTMRRPVTRDVLVPATSGR
jgi:uncharacterized protein YcnI